MRPHVHIWWLSPHFPIYNKYAIRTTERVHNVYGTCTEYINNIIIADRSRQKKKEYFPIDIGFAEQTQIVKINEQSTTGQWVDDLRIVPTLLSYCPFYHPFDIQIVNDFGNQDTFRRVPCIAA